MSSLTSPARVRPPRAAAAAVERARLAVVPNRSLRAPRAPFAVLVFVILVAGVVGLLMFNTHMQQASFRATRLADRAEALAAKRQALDMELERLRDPQRLADAGRKLGMVVPTVPAFVRLGDGTVVGVPTSATPEDAMRILPLPARRPSVLDPKPITHKVLLPVTQPAAKNSGQTSTANGPASAGRATSAGRNSGASAAQGAHR